MVDLGAGSRTIHPLPSVGQIPIEPAFEDYVFMLFDLCEAVGIKCEVTPMMGNINNAIATVHPIGGPLIVYDRRLSPRLGYFGANAVIAHELGHHFCRHLGDQRLKHRHQMEKEADRFMGFAMRKLGVQLSELFGTYEALGIDAASETHPSLFVRKTAIAEGYEANSLNELC